MSPSDLSAPRSLGFTDQEVRDAEELGIDLGLLDENVKLTPSERAEQHDAIMAELMEIQGLVRDAR